MPDRPIPYVGVSGVMTREQTAFLRRAFATLPPFPLHRQLGVFVLASEKTLSGEPNRYPEKYPSLANLGAPFLPRGPELNMVHVSADTDVGLASLLYRAMRAAGPECEGVQVNVAWPDSEVLARWRQDHSSARVVLQIGPRAFDDMVETACSFSPQSLRRLITAMTRDEVLALNVGRYVAKGAITDVLLDGSAGTGKPCDPAVLDPIIARLASVFPTLGIGLAGGLCAASIPSIAPLLRAFPWLNLDAEAKLQLSDQGGLDLPACEAYFCAVRAALRPDLPTGKMGALR